jgi:hypothetical protein
MIDPNKLGGMDAAVLIRRLLFFIVLFGLVFYYLVLNFRGLTDPNGMEQAQIGREIARGNGATTKVIRPAAIWQAQKIEKTDINLDGFYDTYHSPLNPYIYGAVLKAVEGGDFEKYQLKDKKGKKTNTIYRLDQVISAVSIIFFLIAVGINYLLISRIFDVRIAGVTALLMILSELMWKFTQTGLPQMLMLMLFSCALFFIYQAIESSQENRLTIGSVAIAAIFLALLALAHWLTIWIALGFVIYAAFFLRPKGVGGLITLGMLLIFSSYFMIKNLEWTGTPGGTAFLTLYGGLTESQETIMRTSDPSDQTYRLLYNLRSLLVNVSTTLLRQTSNLYANFGSIVVAPLFFFALLHPFRRPSIAQFRWVILLMWLMGSLGMAIFGLSDRTTDPNQLHILFAPIMAAYGMAFVSILWTRLDLPASSPLMRIGHFAIVVILSAGPLILTVPRSIDGALARQKQGNMSVWPPYRPPVLNKILHDATEEDHVIFTDQPHAVAWYADRIAIWLPRKIGEFEDLEQLVEDQQLETAGILITPSSLARDALFTPYNFASLEEFAPMILDGPAWRSMLEEDRATIQLGFLSGQKPGLAKIRAKYPEAQALFGGRMTYFTKKPIIQR